MGAAIQFDSMPVLKKVRLRVSYQHSSQLYLIKASISRANIRARERGKGNFETPGGGSGGKCPKIFGFHSIWRA